MREIISGYINMRLWKGYMDEKRIIEVDIDFLFQ